MRLALNPFVSGIGGLFPHLVSGGAIVAMVLSLLGVAGTLVRDLLLMWLGPRIRMGAIPS